MKIILSLELLELNMYSSFALVTLPCHNLSFANLFVHSDCPFSSNVKMSGRDDGQDLSSAPAPSCVQFLLLPGSALNIDQAGALRTKQGAPVRFTGRRTSHTLIKHPVDFRYRACYDRYCPLSPDLPHQSYSLPPELIPV